MFRYGVNCAFETLPVQQPVILRGDMDSLVQRAKACGYDALELFIRDPIQYDGPALKAAANDAGLTFSGITTGMEYTKNGLSLISDNEEIRKMAVVRLCEHIDLGAQIGAPVIVGIMRGNIPDLEKYQMYEDRFSDSLRQLSDYADAKGVLIYVESIMRYINNYLNSIPETTDYLNRLDRDNVLLHIDTHSMAIEDVDFASAIRYAGKRLGYVHFTENNRKYPGGGNIDFLPIMQALHDIGYDDGYITLECQPYPDEYSCAQMGLEYCKALETCTKIKLKNNFGGY